MKIDRFRTGKAYTVAEAAKLAKTTPATVRRWLQGYEAVGHRMTPVFGERVRAADGEILMLSFLELAEVIVAARFRQGDHGPPIPLKRIREAHDYARKAFHLPCPFATLRLRQEGVDIMRVFDENYPGPRLLALNRGGQWALPLRVQAELEHFDFEETGDRLALRWYPMGKNVPIVVDPHIAAGRPTIHGRNITVATVFQRFEHGETINAIAEDYEIDQRLIEEAIRFAA